MEDEEVTGNVGAYTVTFSPPLGSGTFGMVHKAVHHTSGETFAAKQIIIAEQGQINDYKLKMADSELKILRDLQNHRNIVQLYDCFIKKNVCWIVMEFCDLSHLGTYLRNNKNLPLLERLRIMQQGANGLVFMHNQNPPIIHRDIKLENILMKREGKHDILKITDFGVSKICDNSQSLTQALGQGQVMSTTVGSHFFMAPEFFADSEEGTKYDSSVDVFSLGLTYLVIIDQHSLSDLIPLSISAKTKKKRVSIGNEMVDCYWKKQALPKVIDKESEKCKVARRVKRIIEHMTQFSSGRRKNVDEVKDELDEMVEDFDNMMSDVTLRDKLSQTTIEDRTPEQQSKPAEARYAEHVEGNTCSKAEKPHEKEEADIELCRADVVMSDKVDDFYEDIIEGKLNVAVKVLNEDHRTGVLPREACILRKLHHPHIIKLIGVITKQQPVWIILERMKNGCLLDFLRGNRGIPFQSLINFATQIASGMSYLEKHHILHRGVMAQNMMVDANHSVKVGDFSDAMQLQGDVWMAAADTRFPVKWTAPEAGLDRTYSVKSDVWSFGVVLFEILTFGWVPYSGMTSQECLQKIRRGYRMPKPTAYQCPDELYEIMLQCWSAAPADRPSFEFLHDLLASWFDE